MNFKNPTGYILDIAP